MINAVEISESSIAKITKITAGQKYGLEAAREKESTGNRLTGNTPGSI